MKQWQIIVGVVATALAGYIGFTKPGCEKPVTDTSVTVIDSLRGEVTTWKERFNVVNLQLANCEAARVENTVPIVTKPKPHPADVQEVNDYAEQMLRDSLHVVKKKLADLLMPKEFSDPAGYHFEDQFVRFTIAAYGTYRPIAGKANIQYNFMGYEVKETKTEIVEVPKVVNVPHSYFWIGGGSGYEYRIKEFAPFVNMGIEAELTPEFGFNITLLELQRFQKENTYMTRVGFRWKPF